MNKVAISQRALVARINRKLKKDHQSLRACRENSRSFHNLGNWYVVDTDMNAVVAKDCDLAHSEMN